MRKTGPADHTPGEGNLPSSPKAERFDRREDAGRRKGVHPGSRRRVASPSDDGDIPHDMQGTNSSTGSFGR
jgi:hypothetical protein